MATTRLPDYTGRFWALGTEMHKSTPTVVHHFGDVELRDGWVAMEPETRIAVLPSHPAVRKWLRGDRPTLWQRFFNLFK